jgi:hypothetical protein
VVLGPAQIATPQASTSSSSESSTLQSECRSASTNLRTVASRVAPSAARSRSSLRKPVTWPDRMVQYRPPNRRPSSPSRGTIPSSSSLEAKGCLRHQLRHRSTTTDRGPSPAFSWRPLSGASGPFKRPILKARPAIAVPRRAKRVVQERSCRRAKRHCGPPQVRLVGIRRQTRRSRPLCALGRIDIYRIPIIALARWRQARKWTGRLS